MAARIADGALEDEDQAEALEATADARYSELLADDEALEAVLHARLAENSEAFAPVDG